MPAAITSHSTNRTKMSIERVVVKLANHQVVFSVADTQVSIEFTPNKQVPLAAQFHPMI
jgi:hypothetical protein|tara:strand:+ start:291 stop:467 length:177 start_codon:yes stop_codon:yes gene_type:complete